MSSVTIRPARPSDNDALSRICLLTGAAGLSAEASHSIPELLGLFYAQPYNLLETTFGFVLVVINPASPESDNSFNSDQRIVGYILGTTDTKRFEEIAEREWWPALRVKYPKGPDSTRCRPVVYIDYHYIESFENPHLDRTEADERRIYSIHSPRPTSLTPEDVLRRFPAHIHIDILPSHQVCMLPKVLPKTFLTFKSHAYSASRTAGNSWPALSPFSKRKDTTAYLLVWILLMSPRRNSMVALALKELI